MGDDEGPGAREAIRRYWPMIYAPTALYSMGVGSLVPVLPTIAGDLGATLATAALVAAALVVGQLVGNIPAGALVAHVGERRAMIAAALVELGGIATMLLAPGVPVLAAGALVVGGCASVFALARHAFMTARVPFASRARALALVGGSFRLGTFTGPLIAAALIWATGSERSTLWFFAACTVGVAFLVALGPDPEEKARAAERRAARDADAEDTGEPVTGSIPADERTGLFRTIWRHRRVLSRLGLAAASLAAVRAGRQAVLPLWGLSIGLDSANTALIVGVAGAVEFSLFYASGQVMDRFGRIWATVPSQVLMGSAFFSLAFTHELGTSAMWFGVFAVVVGVGNGLSSGALLTLGADVAPRENTAGFLGARRTLTDGGAALTPLIVSALTAAASLPVATGAVGLIGLAGAVGFWRWVPRHGSRPPGALR
ncbi:MFS transporter [Microbacterium sp. ZXX196]|uniref:MFS transporter n=1 Tax=Microbacterium sp. ZXX196 TaxID=2609291 RepID=UPI0012B86FFF|nr:MFS transporter [Microbacterium sp. ZXX196]MTE22924.1 MFS transporter [Microbacterium sp. ZXX196]